MRKRDTVLSGAIDNTKDRGLASNSQHDVASGNQAILDSYDLEAEMLQWPFIDETWFHGFDTGFDAAWPNLG